MTKNKLAFLTMLAGAVLSLQVAQAQTWSTVASTCEPGSDSIGFYVYSNGSYEFASGETGKIATRCQLNNPLDSGVPSWKTLTGGFQDPDGRGGDYEVQVSLERVGKSSGIHTVLVTLDSNSYSTTGPTSKSITFSHTFDFTNYAYYVLLNVSRNDSNASPSVWYASLK
jgi:hypothetical protein